MGAGARYQELLERRVDHDVVGVRRGEHQVRVCGRDFAPPQRPWRAWARAWVRVRWCCVRTCCVLRARAVCVCCVRVLCAKCSRRPWNPAHLGRHQPSEAPHSGPVGPATATPPRGFLRGRH
eukprot:6698706-Prymnesium_polylepis.2